MNKVVLIGRVAKDITLKSTSNDTHFVNFTLAVNRDYKNEQGGYDADFFNCVAYGQRADTISKFVRKGDRFGIAGTLKNRTYEREDGSTAYITEVEIKGFEFLESKKHENPPEPEVDDVCYEDGDLPF